MGHDAARLSALVTAVVDTRREIARLQAREARLLADAVDVVVARMAERRALRRSTDHDLPMRDVSAELGAAMRLWDRTVQARMGDATTLVERFAATLTAWEAGEVDAAHVAVILDAGAQIGDDDLRARFEQRVLEIARAETAGRLRPAALAIAATLDPDSTRDLHHGQDARRVRVMDLPDGMARLIADLPAPLAYAILDRLTTMGHTVRETDAVAEPTENSDASAEPAAHEGESRTIVVTDSSQPVADEPVDTRTMDQLRADILADLLLAGTPTSHGDALQAVTGHVQITIPVLTLAGTGDAPALLTGYGPIDPDTARRLAGCAPGWDRVLTDLRTGAVLSVDRYRPSSKMRRLLRARDEHCRFPGCRRPARRCDIDHTLDHALGGETADCNLCHLCRRHHTLKHATAWTVRQLGRGVLEWTSPTGRRYRDRPPSVVRFLPDAEPDGDPPPF